MASPAQLPMPARAHRDHDDQLDQYEIIELIARSGMASIYKARDVESGATVVLKVPHEQYERDLIYFERFRREQEIGQRLDHPCIVKVLTPKESSRLYLVLEYVEGKSLRALLDERKPLPTTQALAIARMIGEGLAHMHERQVVHRDLKPENVLITPSGQVKIIDFGIALDVTARRITWSGLSSTMGTPDYMAPEQIAGRRGDPRTDIYALGTIFYEMLTGRLPFLETELYALIRAKTTEQPKAPSYFVPEIDRSLETIALHAIQSRVQDRYRDAAAMLADLEGPAHVLPRAFVGGVQRRPLVSRPFVMALIIGIALTGLGVLAFVTSRHAPTRPPQAQRDR